MARSKFLSRPAAAAPTTARRARAITAAGQRVDLTDQAAIRRATAAPRDWQLRALGYYDELGEVRYGARWMGDAISRLRVIPAYQPSPTDPPVPLEQVEPSIVPDAVKASADGAIARLASGAESGMSGLMRALAINVWLVGEAYLAGYTHPELGEQWDAASVEAITRDPSSGGGIALRSAPGSSSESLVSLDPDSSLLVHIMRRHPRWRAWPDAAMRGALEYCEDLSLLTRMIRATASSRVAAGMLFVPDEASFGSAVPGDADGDVDQDPLTRDLIRHMTEPIRTPGDAAAVVPLILRMSRADIEAVRLESMARPIDALAVELRDEARRSLGAVLDLPTEILTGKGDLNHWSASNIDAEAFAIHVEPLAVLLLDALTTEYYHLALDAAGVPDPGHHRLWYDPSGLVSALDEAATAIQLYDRAEITGAALRSASGVSEDQAPDDAELARRKELAQIVGTPRSNTAPPAPAAVGPPAAEPTPPPPTPGAAAEPIPLADATPRALVASDSPTLNLPDPALVAPAPDESPAQVSLDPLAFALTAIERELRLRVQSAADELARRALERAGNRLRSLAQRDRSGLAARSLTSVPAVEVGATLGPALIATIGTSAADLADGALDALHPRFTRWVGASFQSVLDLIDPWVDPDFDFAPYRARLASGIEDGWAVLSAAVEALVAERIINPTIPTPDAGEFDDTVLVPPGLVRAALVAVGGGPIAPSVTAALAGPVAAEVVGGLITSDMLHEMLARSAGLILGGAGWRWSYGSTLTRAFPYEPHVRLDGLEFTDFHDPKLANSGGWPGPYFHPGDHAYCQCDLVPLLGRAGPVAAPANPKLAAHPSGWGTGGNTVGYDAASWMREHGFIDGGPQSAAQMADMLDGLSGFTPDELQELASTLFDLNDHYTGLLASHPDPRGITWEARLGDRGGRLLGRFVPLGRGDAPYGHYSPGRGNIALGGKNLTKAMLNADKTSGWHPVEGLASVLSHEWGHLVAHTFLDGSAFRPGSDFATRFTRVLDSLFSGPEVAALAERSSPSTRAALAFYADHRNASSRGSVLGALLSQYASGSSGVATAYRGSQVAHTANEGFAELFAIFATPGGCGQLSPVRLDFARLLRSALNDEWGWSVVPDCS